MIKAVGHIWVKDFPRWRQWFIADAAFRTSIGCRRVKLCHGLDDPRAVFVFLETDAPQRLRELCEGPTREPLARAAGLVGRPVWHIMDDGRAFEGW